MRARDDVPVMCIHCSCTAQTWGPAVLPYLPPGGPVGAALLAVGAAVSGRNAFLLAQSSDSG
jgi:hypothetical protein